MQPDSLKPHQAIEILKRMANEHGIPIYRDIADVIHDLLKATQPDSAPPGGSAVLMPVAWWLSEGPKQMFGESWKYIRRDIMVAQLGNGHIGKCQGIDCYVTTPPNAEVREPAK